MMWCQAGLVLAVVRREQPTVRAAQRGRIAEVAVRHVVADD